jgi:cell shape-determining protein MreC
MLLLLLCNFALMAFDAREANTQQRVIRVWMQTTADFRSVARHFYQFRRDELFSSISSMRTAQSENDALKQRVQELEVEVQNSKSLAFENER